MAIPKLMILFGAAFLCCGPGNSSHAQEIVLCKVPFLIGERTDQPKKIQKSTNLCGQIRTALSYEELTWKSWPRN